MDHIKHLLVLALLTLVFIGLATSVFATYFQQSVEYTIRVRLDTDNHKLEGTELINYTNNSPDTLRQFYLHLYPNAFQSKNTAFMQDYVERYNYSFIDLPKRYRSHLTITSVAVDSVRVQPFIDDTVARIDLPKPLPPGGSIGLSLDFEKKIGRQIGRSGYRGDQYDMAQWYPKVVVYDETGFHPDKYRLHSEFYGEFGTYDVYIDVPNNFVVAATGELGAGDPGWSLNTDNESGTKNEQGEAEAYKTVHFHAEDVHDFAWNASPRFVVQDSTWNNVEIRSFYRKGNKEWRDSTLAHGVRAIEWLSERVGSYPYPHVSIVQALMNGGMEYPMLVMDGSVSEGLVLHEVGHIYFYGILGNNERTEAWLDEGFTTFQTGWFMTERYGEHGNTDKWNWYRRLTPQYTLAEEQRRWVFPLLRKGYGERVATSAEKFLHNYHAMVYGKASLMFHALRYVVGEADFDRILKTYYDRWQFKHVNEERFQEVCEEVSGMDLDWFFEQWLHTRKICDYRLAEMKTRVNERGDGYVTRIEIKRIGELTMPLSLEFTFADGTKQTTRIPGRLRSIVKTYEFPEKPKKAAVNPDNEIMDIDLSDNFLPRRYSLQLDWPNNDYYPEHAYQIRYHPYVWYNNPDGARVGLSLKGSQYGWGRRIRLGGYYGTKSHRLDFTASYRRFERMFGNNTTVDVSGYKLEGRHDATVEWTYYRRKQLRRPPTHKLTLGFNYHELRDTRYVGNPEKYQSGSDMAPYFRYQVDPRFDLFRSRLDLGLRFGREWFGGRYKYTRFESSAQLKANRLLVPADVNLRVFLGLISGSAGSMPYQQKFFFAGGGPLADETMFFLRSPDAIPRDANYHEPGHGNLRGYFEGDFGVNRLLALNFELGTSIPILSHARNRFLGSIKVRAFADIGRSYDNINPIQTSERVADLAERGVLERTLFDAGIGFDIARDLPFWNMRLRFDIPFYVNLPEINGETKQTDFRYVFSFKTAF